MFLNRNKVPLFRNIFSPILIFSPIIAISYFYFVKIVLSYSGLRPIADDYGIMAEIYDFGILAFNTNSFNGWNSSFLATATASILLYLATVLPWSVAYYPLPIFIASSLLYFTYRFSKIVVGKPNLLLSLAIVPSLFMLWASSLGTISMKFEMFHFYSTVGWLANSPRTVFAWILLLVVITIRLDTRVFNASSLSLSTLLGFCMGSFGIAEGFTALITIAVLALLQNSFQYGNVFRNKRVLAIELGILVGLVAAIFGPGVDARKEEGGYAINSFSQILQITVGESAKHLGETIGNLVYLLVFVLVFATSSVIVHFSRGKISEHRMALYFQSLESKIEFRMMLKTILVAFLSLSFFTSLASAFAYSAPWHVIGVRNIFFVLVVLTGVYAGIHSPTGKFVFTFYIFAIFACTSLIVTQVTQIALYQMYVRNVNWLAWPEEYGYMADRGTDWVMDGAKELAPIMISLNKDFPLLD